MVLARRAVAGGKRVAAAASRAKKSSVKTAVENVPTLPCLESENPPSVSSMTSSLTTADQCECAVDVSSSLVLGASVECASTQPTIMLGKCHSL